VAVTAGVGYGRLWFLAGNTTAGYEPNEFSVALNDATCFDQSNITATGDWTQVVCYIVPSETLCSGTAAQSIPKRAPKHTAWGQPSLAQLSRWL
jgi:hypothetical protein